LLLVEYVPMRKLYLGYPQELEKKLFDDIASSKNDDPFYPVTVAVENNLAGVYLRRVLARCGSYCRVRFLTLPDLAAELAEGAPDYASRETLPPFGEDWLAALTAREAAGGYFGPVAGRPGFREALRQTFQELEEAGLQQVPFPPNSDPHRIGELQRLFDRYRELRRPFANRGEAFAAAAQSAPAEPFLLALHGIYILSALEKELLASLAAHVKMSIYWQQSAAALAPVKETLQWYQEQGFIIERLPPPPPPRSSLARLQSSLFQTPPGETGPPPAGDMSLEFICAPDEIREVEEITREIIRLARTGVRFGEMAVLLPHFTYSRLIRERLAAAGIPCYLAGGQSLAQARAGRSFLLLLEMIGSDYPRLEVIEFLTYAPIDYRRVLDLETPVSPSFWDYLTMQAGVIKGRRQWREALDRYRRQLLGLIREQEDDDAAAEAGRLRSQIAAVDLLLVFLEKFFEALERFGSCRSWTGLSAVAGEFVFRFFHPGEEREVLRRFLKGLCRLDECGGEFDLKPALELLRSAMQATTLPAGRFQQEGVNLLPLHSAAGLCFTALFIPGLAEKIIPAPVSTDPLLPEAERLALEGALPLRRRKLEVEALRFNLALGGALRKAVLTWPRTAAAGSREQLPSFFLSRCGEALLGTRPGYEQLSLLPGYRYVPAAAREETVDDPVTAVEYDLTCCHHLPPPLQPVQYYRRLSAALDQLLEADLAKRRNLLSPFEGMFTPHGAPQSLLAARLAGWGGRVSATALEDYARCPYSYFLKRLLYLTPLEEPEQLLSMEPLPRGRLVHRILEQFYRRAAAEGLLPVERHPDECRTLLTRVAGEEFDALPPEELPPYPLLWQLQRRSLGEMLRALLDWEIETAVGFVPVDFELSFGFPDSGNQVILSLPSGEKLYFRGRIDRVDRSGSRIRVIDYKTGRKRIKDESLAGGEALQLPVYLLAAGSIFNLPQQDEVEAYAYHLSPAGVKTVLFSGKPWPQKERLLQETAAVLYGGIAAGYFFPYPNPGCRFCDYRTVCGPEIERSFRLKAADPVLASFLKMKEENA
jgi:ATP-dependent helicase/nuclease subunit B